MNIKILSCVVVGLMMSLQSRAQSSLIEGRFVGTVVAGGTGMVGSLDPSNIAAGTSISGTFSYDPQIFQTNASSGSEGLYYALGSVTPLAITETVAGSTFTVVGSVQSQLTLDAFPSTQDPNNHIYLEAMNYGPSVPSGSFSGAIDLNLSNYLGEPFASNVDNPGSVAFVNQSAFGVNDIDTLQSLNSQGNNIGSLLFTITNASASLVAAPEINSASASSSLLLLLGGLTVLFGNRKARS